MIIVLLLNHYNNYYNDLGVREQTNALHGYIKIRGFAIIYGSFPMKDMDKDGSVGGYSKSITVSSDIATSGQYPFCLSTARYAGGFPRTAIKAVSNTTIVISCDVNANGGWVQWMFINKI